jgi:hypothetical protein
MLRRARRLRVWFGSGLETTSETKMAGILESLTRGLTITEYSGWLIFVARLNEAVSEGRVRKVPVLKMVWGRDEEWFLEPETDEIYVYVAPNPPSMPKWEKVDVLAHLQATDPAPLSVFKLGKISPMTAHIMKMKLEDLVSRGLVEELPLPPHATPPGQDTERWYRDAESRIIYRLREHYGLKDPDDLRWEIVPPAEFSNKIQ